MTRWRRVRPARATSGGRGSQFIEAETTASFAYQSTRGSRFPRWPLPSSTASPRPSTRSGPSTAAHSERSTHADRQPVRAADPSAPTAVPSTWRKPRVVGFGSQTQAICDVWDDFASRPPGRRGANNFAGRRPVFGRSQLRGPSRLAGFPLVGFGAKVESGSSDSTMAISSPRSRSERRDGRR